MRKALGIPLAITEFLYVLLTMTRAYDALIPKGFNMLLECVGSLAENP